MMRVVLALILSCLAATASAQDARTPHPPVQNGSGDSRIVDFNAMTTGAAVDAYYAGGANSLGEIGPDYQFDFLDDDWVTTSTLSHPQQHNIAYSRSGMGSVNFLAGLTTGLNFDYGSFTDTTLSLYSGFNGTGALLGSFLLAANNRFDFDFVVIPFAGTAHSLVIAGTPGEFTWDDITFGSLQRAAVPEPEAWAMLILGLGVAGTLMRRHARGAIPAV
jgi:hypothetical protein